MKRTRRSKGGFRLDDIISIAYNEGMNIRKLDVSGIYQIVNRHNGKRYIGQAVNLQRRLYEHKQRRDKGYLSRAINKYGWKTFEFSIIERVDDLSRLNEREQYWMDTFQSYDRDKGYNICREAGSTRGWHHSKETRKHLSEIAAKKTGERNPFFGKHHSEEAKARIGAANAVKGRHHKTRSDKLPRMIRTCRFCGKEFRTTAYEIGRGSGVYCSNECSAKVRRRERPTREELNESYWGKEKSTNELAELYGASKGTIYNWMKQLSIPTRSVGRGVSIAQTGKLHSPEWNAAISKGLLRYADK